MYVCLGASAPCPSLWSQQALKSTQHFFFFFSLSLFFLNRSLLCAENKSPVISLLLKSPALVRLREICLCWAQSSTLQGSAAVWVLPGETVQDGCAIHWWALVQHVRKLEVEQFPPCQALNYPKRHFRDSFCLGLCISSCLKSDESAFWSVTTSLIMLSKSCLMKKCICSIWVLVERSVFDCFLSGCTFQLSQYLYWLELWNGASETNSVVPVTKKSVKTLSVSIYCESRVWMTQVEHFCLVICLVIM